MELDFFSEPRVAEFPTIIAKVDRVLLILSLEADISEFDGLSYGWAAESIINMEINIILFSHRQTIIIL
jgi:hypothetical protein